MLAHRTTDLPGGLLSLSQDDRVGVAHLSVDNVTRPRPLSFPRARACAAT